MFDSTNPLLTGMIVGRSRGVSDTGDQLKLGIVTQALQSSGLPPLASFLVARKQADKMADRAAPDPDAAEDLSDLVEEAERRRGDKRAERGRDTESEGLSVHAQLHTHDDGGFELSLFSTDGLRSDLAAAPLYGGTLAGLRPTRDAEGTITGLAGTFQLEVVDPGEEKVEAFLDEYHAMGDQLAALYKKAREVMDDAVPEAEGTDGAVEVADEAKAPTRTTKPRSSKNGGAKTDDDKGGK